jgi:hypothetical protein
LPKVLVALAYDTFMSAIKQGLETQSAQFLSPTMLARSICMMKAT